MDLVWRPHAGMQENACRRWEFEVFLGGAAGPGKMLALDTPIPTPTGYTEIVDLQPGDTIFDEQGSSCSVVMVHGINESPESYRVTFDDGSTIRACADHLWLTYDAAELSRLTRQTDEFRARRRAKRESRATWVMSKKFTESLIARNKANPTPTKEAPTGTVRTTKTIAQTLLTPRGRRNHAIPVTQPLALPDAELPVDPYVLGVWLGDGTTKAGSVTTADREIYSAITACGYEPGFVTNGNGCATYGFKRLRMDLAKAGVFGNKHIPMSYLRASQEQRLALLQGLMDTDGCVIDDGSCEFTTTSQILAEGMRDLICGLGWKGRIRTGRAKLNGIDCGPKYILTWTPSDYVFRLERKRERQRLATRRTTKFRYIISCDPIEPVPMRCITVDSPSGLYLAGKGMVPTHNTDVIVMEALRYIDYPRYRAVIFRRTYPELEEIIDRTKTWYPAYDGTYKEGVSRWFFPSGATVKLSHMQHEDDKYKHRGKEYQYIGFDEATAFSPTQYLYLFSRARSIDPRIPVRIRAGSNPGGPSHQFFKDRFRIGTGGVEPGTTLYDEKTGLSRVFIPGLLDDNPTLLQNDPGYLARLDMLPEIERMRLRFGVWDAFEGQVFSELNKDVHGCEDFEVPPEWERFRTFDWGYSAPFSCGWWAVDYDGKLYRYREWYGGKDDGSGTVRGLRMSDVEIARGIRKIEEEHGEWGRIRPGPADPSIWSKKRTKDGIIGPSTAEEMSREGIHWIKADNDRIGGKRQVHLRLRLDEDGKPGMLVFNSCEDFWRTIPLLREDPKNIEDVNTDQEDHIYDETRYCCAYRPIKPRPAPRLDIGSFQYERRKYIRARQHAIRYGVSLTEAYGRV